MSKTMARSVGTTAPCSGRRISSSSSGRLASSSQSSTNSAAAAAAAAGAAGARGAETPTGIDASGKAHTHTHIPFDGPLSRTTRVSRYQKGKTDLDFTEVRDSEWQ